MVLANPTISRAYEDEGHNQSYPERRLWHCKASYGRDGKQIKADDFKEPRVRSFDGMNREVSPHDQQRPKNHEPKRCAPIRIVLKLPDEPGTHSIRERLLEQNAPYRGVTHPQHDKYPCCYDHHA